MIKFTRKLSLQIILILALLTIILIFAETTLLLEALLFIFCLGFMLKFGTSSPFDLDPVPFSALLILYISNLGSAIIFLILSALFIDLGTGRFNHHTLINTISITASLLIFSYLLPSSMGLVLGIILFNVTRIMIALTFALGPQTMLFSAIHSIIYAVLGSIILLFI